MHIIVICPNCKDQVIIEQLNCCIFRHGIKKETFENINPHAPRDECEFLKDNDMIYGCGKPFKVIEEFINENNQIIKKYVAILCDYI